MIYWIAFYLWSVISWIYFPLKVKGRRHLPQTGGYLVASNHVSNLDPMIVGLALGRRMSYMAKHSLFRYPVASYFLRQVGAFPVNREKRDIGSVKEALRRLNKGQRLLIFPEGTRKDMSRGSDIQSGIGFLSVKSGACVVPASIEGSDNVMPPGSKWPRRSFVKVAFGEPLTFSRGTPYPQIARQIMKAIEILNEAN